MIKISNIEVFGWEAAIRGMRNPLESWEKSDSGWKTLDDKEPLYFNGANVLYKLGPNDRGLAKRLAKAGSVHAKYRRMIVVQCDILAPLYWWKEFDTYKVGTVANSCSTMHKIHSKEFTMDDFSREHLIANDAKTELLSFGQETNIMVSPDNLLNIIIGCLNNYRKMYLETKDKKWWWQMIQLLPSSYNQHRTVQLNYETLAGMYRDRKNHKLDEWRDFCRMIECLPYSDLITMGVE